MKKNLAFKVCLILVALVAAHAQSRETFNTRLAPVAIDQAMRPNTTGSGSASVTLVGSKLTVEGTFEGLATPATIAQIRQGSAAGVRGPAILDLTVAKATAGKIAGSFDLTPAQVENLKKGKWYIQIHSEKAPDGNLWGWLLK